MIIGRIKFPMANKNSKTGSTDNLEQLITTIQKTNEYFLKQVQKQLNTAFTFRNWLIGFYLVQYEQQGKDRAAYGKQIYKAIDAKLKSKGLKPLGERNLYLCKDFYSAYPEILQTVSAKSYLSDFQSNKIQQTLSAKSNRKPGQQANAIDPNLLLTRLSFSHFIELIKADSPLRRRFY